MSNSKKVLLIGWDAADWKVIHPLMDDGVLPNLKKLVENGVMSEISTLHPVLSPMLWTSIATGKRPCNHGIHGFMEPTVDGLNVQPITNLSRSTKAVWNILNQQDMRSLVVGWWPSHPAEPIDGVMVSNSFHKVMTTDLEQKWPMANGTVYPPELSQELAEFRFHPAEIDEDVIRTFLPLAEKIDQEKDQRLWMCAKMMAEATSIQGVATHLMETQDWDFAAVYFDAIDHFSHGFMKYHPPQQKQIPDKDFEIYSNVVKSGYIYHDMMLGNMLSLVDDDTTVILLSDHGFHPDHMRPIQIPNEPAGPAIEHRDFGIFVIKGPGIKKDTLIHGVNLLDITPTVLQLFDLPVGDDMDGHVVTEAFETHVVVETIESWDNVEGRDGQHPPERKLEAAESEEALKQLVELGYVEPLDVNTEVNVKNARRELKYNLARSYMDGQRFGDAVDLLHELYADSPSEYRYGIQLAMCFKSLNRIDDLDNLIQQLQKQRMSDAVKARDELEKYKNLAYKRYEARFGAKEEGEVLEMKEAIEKELFGEEEKKRIQSLSGLASVSRFSLDFLRGYCLAAQNRPDEAVEVLTKAIKSEPDRPGYYLLVADAYFQLRKWDAAQAIIEKALRVDPHNSRALMGLGRCHLGRRENAKAIEFLLQAVGQMFHFPLAHYYLGVALHRLGKIERAVDALKLSIAQNPNNTLAYGRLGYIFKNKYEEPNQANEYFALAREARDATRKLKQRASEFEIPEFDPEREGAADKYSLDRFEEKEEQEKASKVLPTLAQTTAEDVKKRIEGKGLGPIVTIVTGLPRTGTSMAMQMLDNGGIPALTDGNRVADDDNPRGYLEFDPTKTLASDNSWVVDAEGKSIKVIAQLLQYLPKQCNYRVIFMDRPMDEILASQQTMLERNEAEGGDLSGEQLRRVFNLQLKNTVEMLKTARIPTMRLSYHEVLGDPETAANAIRDFTGQDLNVEAMVASVDPDLYRQKIDEKAST